MTNSIKKKLRSLFKSVGYRITLFFYGKIKGIINIHEHDYIQTSKIYLDKKNSYKIYKIKKCRIYTDTVTDTAFILENKIINGPSFQHRNPKNAEVKENIVFKIGTPKFKKKLNGTVFSLLTGGGGNANYWHWLFDVLPRFKILEEKIKLETINYFLFPDLQENFQRETLDLLNIPNNKRISSRIYRHVQSEETIIVDHPYVIRNDPSIEIQNIPNWIMSYLRKKFLINEVSNDIPKKIYIDRSDSKSNHRHLRQIINENEVKEFLEKKNFSIVKLASLSFIDQIKLFNNADEIVGLHGAGFANLTFCEPGTKILELKSNSAGLMFGNLASKMNLQYQDISVKPSKYSNNDQQGLITIPLNLLEKKIS